MVYRRADAAITTPKRLLVGEPPDLKSLRLSARTYAARSRPRSPAQAYNGFTNLGASGGQALQDTMKANNNLTPDAVAQAHADYTNLLVKPQNMTTEAYQRGLRDTVLSNAQNGNWQAVRAIKDMPAWQEMPTQMKDNLEVQVPRLEQEWALKNPAARNLFTSRADLRWSLQHGTTGMDSSPEGHAKLDAAMDTMEDSNRKLNGDATAMYDNEQRAQMRKMLDAGKPRCVTTDSTR
ncbi:hypothetical protein WJ40_14525 [Burkholderia cepacia]|nr:hypothetical protein WJ40_14525 [Burkholderia cepacia]